MKHNLKITLLILAIFLLAQFIGILIVKNYIDTEKTTEAGKTVFKELPIGERPPLEESTSFLWIMLAIILGTGIFLLIAKFNLTIIWKIWFLLAVVIALSVAFGAFIPTLYAFILAGIVGMWKIFKPNFWVQNISELFIYGGLAAIFSPLLNLWSMSILLVLIAAYDAYAVWSSKHMIKLAESQTKAKIFAGLLIPYELPKRKNLSQKVVGKAKKVVGKVKKSVKEIKVKTAILGGGDIGFPLIFAGVVLKEWGLWQSLLMPLFAALGLGFLLWKGKKDRFYPAMPFISAGCFLGLFVVWLLSYF